MSKGIPTAEQYAVELASLVRDHRESLGLTQLQLAEEAGVSRHLVSNIENAGASGLTLSKVAPILGVLGLALAVVPGIQMPATPLEPSGSELNAYFDERYPVDGTLFGDAGLIGSSAHV